ncbi:MAG: hypothetical protein D6730_03940 [Bacteroidetes bacterium]|nr:MAG: hypothetical protein D6730_03940 [Bacteroidota bacterium]
MTSICRLVLLCAVLLSSCKIQYNFTGGSLNPDLETISIAQFINEAPLVVPTLAQDFTIALQDRFLSGSRLSLTSGAADINISGVIIDYRVDPVAFTGVTSDERAQAAQNRLKITVRVKYDNNVDPNESWEQTFSSFTDFDASLDFTAVEQEKIAEVLEQLTQDIFNKSLGKW